MISPTESIKAHYIAVFVLGIICLSLLVSLFSTPVAGGDKVRDEAEIEIGVGVYYNNTGNESVSYAPVGDISKNLADNGDYSIPVIFILGVIFAIIIPKAIYQSVSRSPYNRLRHHNLVVSV